ncbi:hypothetical protein [Agrococcus sp. ARC_14]|uniref:hypothetical protein n=1 Tax=Agrococcus sp. ARC_14 TaxID=2919927 RepID=UPI001F051ACE|nr:hypothetical protein [Agrococcus sp. ARC_14]MCH1882691.1 hypothetical protein [Agrococcus sp. ARC_14]
MQLRPISALALTAALALGLVGCMSTPPDAAEETSPETSQSDSGETTETTDAAAEPDAGNPDAPIEGWPAEVPVPDGELQQDASAAGQIVGAFQVADTGVSDAYAAELEAAGFAPMEGGATEIAGTVATVYQGDTHIVAISTVEAGGTVLLSVAIQAL